MSAINAAPSPERFDVAIVGAGAVGLAAALVLAADGFRVALVGPAGARPDGRTVALLDGSVRLLQAAGVWEGLQARAAPLEVLRIVDDTGSLFRPPPASFRAGEIGLGAFGWNIESAALVSGLGEAALAAGIAWRQVGAERFDSGAAHVRLTLSDGTALDAALLVAADGRRSRLREAAGIATRERRYPQSALTTLLLHDRPHDGASTEFHTREGPFTLVPLPGHRSSLVWVTAPERGERLMALDDAGLARAIEEQSRSMLGRVGIDGPRGLVPIGHLTVERYSAPRLALTGEAAHALPPIGAQGLNLGMRDVAALRDRLVDARKAKEDLGGQAVLASYERGRRRDVPVRAAAVDLLNRSLLADLLPADLARGLGLAALASIGPLRRLVMRQGLSPALGTPRLMRRSG